MPSVAVNPGLQGDTYLRCLNSCFPNQWNAARMSWFMERPFGGRKPDTIAVDVDGQMVAGIGLNYRQLALPGGRLVDVVILTAAWALPNHQGRGHFQRLVRAAAARATEGGCAAMLSFVTADNASCILLRRMGAFEIPTRYLSATANAQQLEAGKPLAARQVETPRWQPAGRDAIHVHYRNRDDWRAQLVDRPDPTSAWRIADTTIILERVGDTDRLQYVSDPDVGEDLVTALAQRATRNGRHFFHFTTNLALAEKAERNGLQARPGNIMVNVLDEAHAREELATMLKTAPWHIDPGDRM